MRLPRHGSVHAPAGRHGRARRATTLAFAVLLGAPLPGSAAAAGPGRDGMATESLPLRIAHPKRAAAPVDEALRRERPGRDNWATEALAAAVGGRLDQLARWIEDPRRIDHERVADMIADGFTCDALRPPDLKVAYHDGTFTVRRASGTASAPRARGVDGLVEALRALRRGLGSNAAASVDFEIHRLASAPGHFTTRVFYEGRVRDAAGGSQQNADWRLRWTGGPGSPEGPRLQSIELLDYEEVAIGLPGGALFTDHTESALRGTPAFREQVQRGVMHWAERIGALESISIFGHAGLAVGDVNGDGLDDLYVCAEGGLPNRLYTQSEDGTLRDLSSAAGVDWLEPSFNALLVDLDNDGDQDLAVATLPSLLLAENDGKGRFAMRARLSVAQEAYALTAADYDNDGDLDLYATTYGGLGSGARGGDSDSATVQGGGHTGGHAAARAFDPLDDAAGSSGPPEIVVTTPGVTAESMAGTALPVPYHDANNGGPNVLLRNEGRFRFANATAESGLDQNNHRFSFAAAWEDYDNDGDPDLYVANDFGRNNLYRNVRGVFVDVAPPAGVEDVGAGMSVSWGDYDRDGWMDLYVGNMFSSSGTRVAFQEQFAAGESAQNIAALQRTARGNSLFTNERGQGFRDDSEDAAVNDGRWAWSSNFADLNNDGWLDLVVANGFLTGELPGDLCGFFWREIVSRTPGTRRETEGYAAGWEAIMRLVRQGRSWNGNERNTAFLNCGPAGFADVSAISGLDYSEDGRGIALVDWDHDGDLDMWLRNRTAPRLRLMLNQLPRDRDPGDFLAVRLRGTTCNRDAIGARVEVELRDGTEGRLIQTLRAGEGFRSQSSKWLHFGLGEGAVVQAITVRWPGGTIERFENVRAGKRYRLVQGSGEAVVREPPQRSLALGPSVQEAPSVERPTRIVLSHRAPPLALRYTRFDGGPAEIPRSGRPLLVNLWHSACAPCLGELEQFVANERGLREVGLDLLALTVDGLDEGGSTTPADARRRLETLGFPFDSGIATAELLDKLELLQEALLGRVPPFAVPLNLLFDAEGRLVLIYRGAVDVERLTTDLEVLRLTGEELRRAALPFDGRWYTGYKPIEAYLRSSLALLFRERYPEESVRFLRAALEYHRSRRQEASLPREREGLEEELAEIHFTMAELLAAQGRREEAIGHYREVLALRPGRVAAHTGLGVMYAELGKFEEATRLLREALDREPDDTRARHNLGLALQAQGRIEEAIREYRQVLRVDPDFEATRYGLGAALYMSGRSGEAIEQFREALRLNPDALGPLTDMAWILATDPDPGIREPATAIRMAERAAELAGNRDATVLDTLAAAYAGDSRFAEAVRTAEAALVLATETREAELARYIAGRLELYRRGAPYREAPF